MPATRTTRRGNGPGWGGPAKGEGHRFVEGDPLAGRPKGMKPGEGKKARAAELAREHVSDAVEVWRQIMSDPTQPAQARLAAAAHMVDRAEGKAVQPSDITSGGERIGYVIQAPAEAESADEWAKQHTPH